MKIIKLTRHHFQCTDQGSSVHMGTPVPCPQNKAVKLMLAEDYCSDGSMISQLGAQTRNLYEMPDYYFGQFVP